MVRLIQALRLAQSKYMRTHVGLLTALPEVTDDVPFFEKSRLHLRTSFGFSQANWFGHHAGVGSTGCLTLGGPTAMVVELCPSVAA